MRHLLALCLLAASGGLHPRLAAADAPPPADFDTQVKPLLQKFCVGCHNAKKRQGELDLAAFSDEASTLKARPAWAGVRDRVERREMPPDDAPRPTTAEADLLSKWAAGTVKRIDAATPPRPGRVTMRRLNRAEYRNTVRDLLGVSFDLAFDPTRDFPGDGAGYGFDTIGDVLSVSPLHLEKYLAAASQVLGRAVVVDGLDGPRAWAFAGKDLRAVSPTKPAGEGGLWPTNWVAEFDVRQAGEYRVKAVIRSASDNGKQAQMAVGTDGRPLERFTLTRGGKATTAERKLVVPEGGRVQVWVAYLHEQGKPLFEPADAANGALAVESLEVSGPYFDAAKLPASHRKLVVSRPTADRPRPEAAREVLAAFLPRAFRRPVPAAEVTRYVALFTKADRPGESFEAALLAPLKAALVSPHFLYRVEVDRPAADGSYPLDAHELASRLSYFLWSSLPDDELFTLAAAGTLTDPKVLEAQTRRMLADPKANALSENFVGQWLGLRGLDTFQPDPKAGKIGTGLRNGMRAEPVLLFHDTLTAGRPLTELISADHAFLNEELARFYKLPPAGPHADPKRARERDLFVRYELPPDAHRGGLLTTAAVLTATSHPDRTSPVKRGKFVLDALLGAPPPPPPPAVAALADAPEAKGKVSLRARLEAHRTAAACASCHKRMDPLGFAFEHYDGLGRWRDKDGNAAIDDAATLPDGKTLAGVPGLTAYLLGEKDAFARCLTEKLLTYALGRGVEPFDARTVDAIADAVRRDEYRLSRVVVGVVTSEAFCYRSTGKDEGSRMKDQ